MRKKACKKCKILTNESECPICHSQNLTTNWKGKVYILNPEKSHVAEFMGIQMKGEFAIKVR